MTPTLMLSCAAAVAMPAARAMAARVAVPANCFMSVLRDANGAGRRSRNYSMVRSYRTTWAKNRNARMPLIAAGGNPGEMGRRGDERTEPVSQANSLRLEAGNDLARDELDLLHLILVGHEDDLLRSDR